MFIINEYLKGQSSFWYPYISLIEDDHFPIFWNDSFLKELQDEYLVESINQIKNDLYLNYYSLVKENIIDKEKVDVEYFMKVYSFVMSRNFYISEEQSLLVPMADCLNHNIVNVKYEFYDSDNLVFKYTKELDEDVEIVKTNNNLFKACSINNFKESDNVCVPIEDESDTLYIADTDYFVISTAKQIYHTNQQVYNF